MVFSSSLFLAYFLPFFFITYYFIEAKYKNIVLFLFSLCFYTFGCFDNLYYVLILILSLIIVIIGEYEVLSNLCKFIAQFIK